MTDNKIDKPEKEEKTVRVQFGKDATYQAVADGIRMMHDKWALEHPTKAYERYPSVYAENGKRIRHG